VKVKKINAFYQNLKVKIYKLLKNKILLKRQYYQGVTKGKVLIQLKTIKASQKA
jgi:hypothetical protein